MTIATTGDGFPYNFPKGFQWGVMESQGTVLSHDAETLVVDHSGIEWTFAGQGFDNFDGRGWAGSGLLTGITASLGGMTLFDFSDMAIDMAEFRFLMDRNDSRGGLALMFRGDDEISGAEQNDALLGLSGDDVLHGFAGRDVFIGGLGQDTMTGGKGKDWFVFQGVSESTAFAPDLITGLKNNDRVDLRRIDTDKLTAGDQAFVVVAHFTGAAGELKVSYDGVSGLTLIEGDTDGDLLANLVIHAAGDLSGYANFML